MKLSPRSRRWNWRAALVAALCAAAGAHAQSTPPAMGQAAPAAPLAGIVTDATSGKPAAGVQVEILVPGQQGMQSVGAARTGAHGHFQISPPAAGVFLLAAQYRGVEYYQPVHPGAQQLRLEVFQTTSDTRQLRVHELATVLQPEKGQLAVVDEYMVNNRLSPPRTWYRPGGIFRFLIPRGIKADGAQVIGPDGMTVPRDILPTRQPGIYTLKYPLRPGQTRVQVSYRLPYTPPKAALDLGALYPVNQLQVYVPSPMQFVSPRFSLLGSQDGYQVYGLAHPPARLRVQVAGDAPLPQAMQSIASASASPSGAGTAAGAADASSPAAVIPSPNFVEKNFLTLLAGLALLAAAMLFYKLRQPEPLPAAARASAAPPAALPDRTAPVSPAGDGASPAAESADDMQLLKNDLFLLEARRHTHNISNADYEHERRQLEERMRRLLNQASPDPRG